MLSGIALVLLLALSPLPIARAARGAAAVQPKAEANLPAVNPSESLQKPSFSSLNAAKQMSQAFVDVSRKVTPSIVMIVNEEKLQNVMGGNGADRFFQDDFFRNFFGDPRQREQVQKTLGSGVIISSDGYVITNNHVVDNSTKLQVTLADGRKVPGKIIGKDAKTDLALVKVEARNLTPIDFGAYDDIQVGEWVLAIGSPFGEALHHTVTAGIISAKGRSNVGIADYEDFLQTDAAINPGNSGGALVDLDGKLIGINTAILSASGGNSGVGFAIPINMVQRITTQLKSNGRVIRGYLGVTIQDLTPEMKKSLNADNYKGAIVSSVENGSPAEKAGLKQYDIIESVNGQPVSSNVELRDAVASLKPESKAELGVIRDGKKMTVDITVGELKGDAKSAAGGEGRGEQLGMELQNLTPDIARQVGSDHAHGVVITQVQSGSAAEEAGLQEGDVIFQVNRQDIRSVQQLQDAIEHDGDSSILLAVDRQGNTFFVSLQLH